MSGTAAVGGLSKYELWYGRAEKPAARTRLTSGDLSVELEGADIRAVRLGEVELLRNVYVALRDEDWGTIPGTLSDYQITRGDDEFVASFRMAHEQAPISFTWTGRIAGQRSGVITYELDGESLTAFKYCRIGFCLLHPPERAGSRYRGNSPQGEVAGTLPRDIGPQVFERGIYWPLFPSVSELQLFMPDGTELSLVFEGDLFEMEDQRNWTDASFKTYCTPQELGYPFDARPGQQFHQKITFEVVARPALARAGATAKRPTPVRVELNPELTRTLPPIGFALPRAVDQHSDAELALLRAAHPSHLRTELVLAGDGWTRRLAAAGGTADALGCPLEIAAFANTEGQVDELIDELASLPVARLLLFAYEQEMSDPAMTRRARAREVSFPVIGGTDLWFAELNRDRPDASAVDGLVYTITPQVHTFDEESIAQSLEAEPDTVRTAMTFAEGLPVVISPVTLRPRDPVHVDHFKAAPAWPDVPFSVDPRQSSLFAAAWTVGSIAALGYAGAGSLTYYETVGCRGIIPGDSPTPELFVGAPSGGAFAMFHVFADVLEPGLETMLVKCRSDRPTQVCALALGHGETVRVLVANLTAEPVSVDVDGLPGPIVAVRTLDERTGNEALANPLAYRAAAGPEMAVSPGRASVDLAPYAVLRLEGGPAR